MPRKLHDLLPVLSNLLYHKCAQARFTNFPILGTWFAAEKSGFAESIGNAFLKTAISQKKTEKFMKPKHCKACSSRFFS